jgi:hypothetical protein
MRSNDVKIHRTDGSCNTAHDDRLVRVRAAIQTAVHLARKVVLLHDHKGQLTVYSLEGLNTEERQLVRALWAVNCEPAECVEFVTLRAEA